MKVVFTILSLFLIDSYVAQQDHINNLNAEGNAHILRYDNINHGLGGFHYAYETSNGISQQEQGEIINIGTENEGVAVRGSYQYIGPDGVTYTVNYIADENGFQPQGAHIPKAR